MRIDFPPATPIPLRARIRSRLVAAFAPVGYYDSVDSLWPEVDLDPCLVCTSCDSGVGPDPATDDGMVWMGDFELTQDAHILCEDCWPDDEVAA